MKRYLGTSIMVLAIAAGVMAGRMSVTSAKEAGAKVTKDKKSPQQVVPAGVTVNACGCYRNEAGACFCGDKNGRCACPGECEPISCAQKRSQEIQREIAAETKKAQDEEKRRQREEAAASAAAAQTAAAQADAGVVASGNSTSDETDSTDTTEKKPDDAKAEKPSTTKGRKRTVAKP
ncbi:MAG: hypothetical protein QOI66_3803 [Myxococcales bacterium]|jgi:hypothetical protein|nr:hypothetical protein [Myxococcales bacterium]